MAVVAGTPVIDSPTAKVATSLPLSVTRTMAALRCDCFTTSLTMRITASASADSVGVAGDSDCRAADAQLVSRTSAHSRVVARKMTGIPRILAEGGLAAR